MKVEVIDSIEKLLLYEAEWKSILSEMNNDAIFLEPDWIVQWWKFFGGKHRLFVLIIINDQGIAGICPLMTTKKGICNEISFIGERDSDSADFILRNEHRENVLKCICDFLRNLKGINIIRIHRMLERSENYVLLNTYFKENKVAFVMSDMIHYFLNTKDSDFNTHFERRFSKKTRETMNSKEKKLNKLGELSYKKVASSKMDEVFEVHEKRWLRKIGNSSFSKGESKEFYKALASDKNVTFNISVDAITLNNRIISFMYGFEYKKKYLFIRIAHDDDFSFLSPGELVLKKKIEECFLSQINVFDFGSGNDQYKAKWSDDYEIVSKITFSSNSFQSRLIFYIKYWTGIKLINALRKNEKIFNFRKYTLGKLKLLLSKAYITEKINSIKRNAGQNRLPVYLAKVINDLTGKIFGCRQHYILERNITNLEAPQNNLYTREATIDDLETLSQVMNEASSKIIRRFVKKHKCIITFFQNQIIHYCWINCSNIEISSLALSIPLKKAEVHIYDVFIGKKYKNIFNYKVILTSVFNLLYKENYKRCYITLDFRNRSFERKIYKQVFFPKYKILEKRLFGTVKHNIIELT